MKRTEGPVTKAMVENISILAKLELTEKEKEQAGADMNRMLAYIDKMNELDTAEVIPMSHAFPVENIFREDVVTNGDMCDETLHNAPAQKDNMFVVPRTV